MSTDAYSCPHCARIVPCIDREAHIKEHLIYEQSNINEEYVRKALDAGHDDYE